MTVICPVVVEKSKLAASVPLKLYSSSSLSGSVADTTAPTFVPAVEFSAMLRLAVPDGKAGGSFTSVTLMVTGTE